MEEAVRTVHCPKCNTSNIHNIAYFPREHTMSVYVECAKCKQFIGRYEVSQYTSGRAYEDALQDMQRSRPHSESGREIQEHIHWFTNTVAKELEHVRKVAAQGSDPRRLHQLISDYQI